MQNGLHVQSPFGAWAMPGVSVIHQFWWPDGSWAVWPGWFSGREGAVAFIEQEMALHRDLPYDEERERARLVEVPR